MGEREVVDEILGAGTYQAYAEHEANCLAQIKDLNANLKAHKSMLTQKILRICEFDIKEAERFLRVYKEELKKVARLQSVDETRLNAMFDCLTLAVEILMYDNQVLGQLTYFGIAAALKLLPFQDLKKKAEAMWPTLLKLKSLLDQAKKEAMDSAAQLALNASITVLMGMMGPVGILTRVGVAYFQIEFDAAFGYGTSELVTRSSQTNTVSGQLAGAIEDMTKISDGAKTAAKRAGKASTAVGVLFDAYELKLGVANERTIRAQFEKVNKEYHDLMKFLIAVEPKLDKLFRLIRRAKKSMMEIDLDSQEDRKALAAEMLAAGFKPL